MNRYFSRSGISFTYAKTDYTRHPVWARGEDQMGMKRQLRQGGYTDLNLYYMAVIPGPAADGSPSAGICYLPVPRDGPVMGDELARDGCMMLAQTAPGAQPRYPSDMTTTHEVGHWLGLLHTFEGDACGAGDTIQDTYPQQEPTHRCDQFQFKFNDGRPAVQACGWWYSSNMLNLMDYS